MAVGGKTKLPDHGTEARYMRGDRCSACKSARAAAQRDRRKAKQAAEANPVASINDAPSKAHQISTVEAAVQVVVHAAATDPATQVHAQMALALARRLDNGDSGAPSLASQLQVLLAHLKPDQSAEDAANAPGAPRLTRFIGTRGRLDPGAVPGSHRAAAVGDEA